MCFPSIFKVQTAFTSVLRPDKHWTTQTFNQINGLKTDFCCRYTVQSSLKVAE